MKFGIRYKYTDKLSEYEDRMRGYCNCILVFINGKQYPINVDSIDLISGRFLRTDLVLEYYHFSYNMIIVNEVTKSEIKKAISELSKTNFFDKLGGRIEINSSLNVSDEEIKITYLNDSDEYYSEVCRSGYRDDIVVRVGQKVFNVNVMTIDRLLQDFGYEIKANNYYLTKPNLIIVRTMDIQNIENAIYGLCKEGFFSRSGPLDEDSDWGIFEYLHSHKNDKKKK